MENLGSKLRDLQGYASLASELIQNGDDVPGASFIRFDVRREALYVENDGVFSDCAEVDLDECPWRNDSQKGHRCDFHRFRRIAAGDKRNERGTTGAFGIGFIAVYQITDQPELISNGRHWIIREARPEDERIEVCSGCDRCRASDLPSTRFILPWALDETSDLRRRLRAAPIPTDGPSVLLEDLELRLSTVLLFLKRIRRIEVTKDRVRRRCFERIDVDPSILVSDGATDQGWHLVRGDFSDVAKQLRDSNPHRVEAKRSAEVTIGIPHDGPVNGLLYAVLPTQHETGLPFHIHSDFFSTSDRKRIVFESDYQSEWNRSAIVAAARALAGALDRLPQILGHDILWEMLTRLEQVARDAQKGSPDPVFAELWNIVATQLPTTAVVYTTRGKWQTPSQTVFLLREEEDAFSPVLAGLDLNIVHKDLRRHLNLLRGEAVGVAPLYVSTLCEAVAKAGLVERVGKADWPPSLRKKGALNAVWQELNCLTEGRRRSADRVKSDNDALRRVALALAIDGALWPCGDVCRADEETVALFREINPSIPFLAPAATRVSALESVCPEFNVTAAVKVLQQVGLETLMVRLHEGRLHLGRLFAWLEDRRSEIRRSSDLKHALTRVPIFPSSSRLHVLSDLALPGNFDDPLGLTEVVDLDMIGRGREFLRELGMRQLSFIDFVEHHLPRALKSPDVLCEKRRRAVELLATHLGDIKDVSGTSHALASCPLVECEDGRFRKPHGVYFPTKINQDTLGAAVAFAVCPQEYASAHEDLYRWLGVASIPRPRDLIARVQGLTAKPPTDRSREAVAVIFNHLGTRIQSSHGAGEFAALCSLAWLPARNRTERWWAPSELYAIFQDYLFETQAQFLDIARSVQGRNRAVIESLGVSVVPSTVQVVGHLIACADAGRPVNPEVYNYLNNHAKERAVLALRGKACLLMPNGRYVPPKHVFWGEHRFGRYRIRLGVDLRRFARLFNSLGVREEPDWHDAKSVLHAIAREFSSTNRPLDHESQAALSVCWQLMECGLDSGKLSTSDLQEFREVKCVLNRDNILYPPYQMFIENRTGLAAKFKGRIDQQVITRPSVGSRAMTSAGVRILGEALRIQLIAAEERVLATDVQERISERHNQIARVLQAQALATPIRALLDQLAAVTYEDASELIVRYVLKAFNHTFASDLERVPAIYHREDGRLRFVRVDGLPPWPALARELAVALLPDEDPGRLAAGIKEALAANTDLVAAEVLDQLGFAPLSLVEYGAQRSDAVVETLGGDTEPQQGEAKVEPGEGTGTDTGSNVDQPASNSPVDQFLGTAPGTTQPSRPPNSGETEHAANGTRMAPEKTSPSKPRARLRTYVVDEVAEHEGASDVESIDNRSVIESEGVRKVLDAEKASGRCPKEMPPMHPGYDIESRNESGEVDRYIEVKSISGEWDALGVALSKPQFDKAHILGTAYWLYVVERAAEGDARIYRIQDPARRVGQFLYDDGWRDASSGKRAETEETNS